LSLARRRNHRRPPRNASLLPPWRQPRLAFLLPRNSRLPVNGTPPHRLLPPPPPRCVGGGNRQTQAGLDEHPSPRGLRLHRSPHRPRRLPLRLRRSAPPRVHVSPHNRHAARLHRVLRVPTGAPEVHLVLRERRGFADNRRRGAGAPRQRRPPPRRVGEGLRDGVRDDSNRCSIVRVRVTVGGVGVQKMQTTYYLFSSDGDSVRVVLLRHPLLRHRHDC